MEQEANDVMILSAINQGAKKFDKISKKTKIDAQEIKNLLERLEERGFITIVEKKGLFGLKKEIVLTEKGSKELEERRFECNKTGIKWWKYGKVETSKNFNSTWMKIVV